MQEVRFMEGFILYLVCLREKPFLRKKLHANFWDNQALCKNQDIPYRSHQSLKTADVTGKESKLEAARVCD